MPPSMEVDEGPYEEMLGNDSATRRKEKHHGVAMWRAEKKYFILLLGWLPRRLGGPRRAGPPTAGN